MNVFEILKKCDHTILTPTATWGDVQKVIDEAYHFNTASVCIQPCFVHDAEHYVGDQVKICTVIGFPNGYSTLAVKEFETKQALDDGASEIDMVINVGALKGGNLSFVQREIETLKKACGNNVLKVIVEACLLTEEEKISVCKLVTDGGADYIKTSTGFSHGGATFSDVELFKKYVGKNVKIKAAGGIKTLEDANKFITLGCDRLGTSTLVKIAKELQNQ